MRIFRELNKNKINSALLAIITIFSMVGVLYIQKYIRSQNLELSEFGEFLKGTLPNFFAATGYCAIIFLWHRAYALYKGNYKFWRTLIIDFLIVFLGLTLWEIILFIIDKTPIDIYDILMSLIGSILVVIIIIILYRKDYKRNFETEFNK